MLKPERTLGISNTVFLISTLKSPKRTRLFLQDMQGVKTWAKNRQSLKMLGAGGE